MQLCAACSRHVFHDAPACPFCGASLRASPAPATTLIGLALGVALAGCGGKTGNSEGGSSSSGDTTSTSEGSVSASTTSGGDTDGQRAAQRSSARADQPPARWFSGVTSSQSSARVVPGSSSKCSRRPNPC